MQGYRELRDTDHSASAGESSVTGGVTGTLPPGRLTSAMTTSGDIVELSSGSNDEGLERSINISLSSVRKISLELEDVSWDVVNAVVVLALADAVLLLPGSVLVLVDVVLVLLDVVLVLAGVVPVLVDVVLVLAGVVPVLVDVVLNITGSG